MESQVLDEPTDIGLLQRAKVGDFAAFRQLVAKLQPRVYGLAYRILQQTQDAEDATQQTFLAIIEHIADFREESSVATWVLKITTNHALKILRKKRGGKMVSMTDMASDDNYNDIPHPEFIAPGVKPQMRSFSRPRCRRSWKKPFSNSMTSIAWFSFCATSRDFQ